MASLHLSSPVFKSPVLLRRPHHKSEFSSQRILSFPKKPINNLSLHCASSTLPLKLTSPFLPKHGQQSIIRRCNIAVPFHIDAQENNAVAPEDHANASPAPIPTPTPTRVDHVQPPAQEKEAKKLPKSNKEEEEEPFRLFKWPITLIGPSVLLMTASAPALWLPLPSVIEIVDLSGFLSLVGLDCVFNIGATLFFLVSDAYGRPKRSLRAIESRIPLSNKLWNMVANAAGFAFPLVMLMVSSKYILRPPLPFISFAVMLGPYLLMLAVQIVAEVLTWKWKSPAWLVVPVVYEVYRLLQLRRALRLALMLEAPVWSVKWLLILISWWLFVLVIQLLRVSWFSGYAARSQQRLPV